MCMDFTLRSGPSNKFSLGCHRDSFQKCHSITPPTEGWLKYMVKRFPKASAFLTSSASSTVNSVAQISRPASASLSILYCTHIERFLLESKSAVLLITHVRYFLATHPCNFSVSEIWSWTFLNLPIHILSLYNTFSLTLNLI